MNDGGPIRGHIRSTGFRRVSHGLFLPSTGPPQEDVDERLRELSAWLLVLPDGSAFTHLTAAWLYGWWLPSGLDPMPTFAAVPSTSRGPRRPGLLVSRPTHGFEPVTVRGLPVVPAEEALLACARELGLLDLVPLVESALRNGHVDSDALSRVAHSGRPGTPQLRRAVALANARSQSPWETKLRMFHQSVGVAVEVQKEVRDDGGRLIAIADLWVVGTNSIHEYDGAGHRTGSQHVVDLRRDRGIASSSWIRRGFTARDLLHHDLVVLAELDRVVGRRPDPSRIGAWRRLVAMSSHSDEGRARLHHRWKRAMGVTEWSRTA